MEDLIEVVKIMEAAKRIQPLVNASIKEDR
jgi:hypothetical protein